MQNEEVKKFKYSRLSKHIGLIYAIATLVIFVPLPFYGHFFFGHNIYENAVIFFAAVGLIASVIYIWSDFSNQALFSQIELHKDKVVAEWKNERKVIPFSEINKIEEINYGHRLSFVALGATGIRLVSKTGKQIPIFRSIDDFDNLVKQLHEHANFKTA